MRNCCLLLPFVQTWRREMPSKNIVATTPFFSRVCAPHRPLLGVFEEEEKCNEKGSETKHCEQAGFCFGCARPPLSEWLVAVLLLPLFVFVGRPRFSLLQHLRSFACPCGFFPFRSPNRTPTYFPPEGKVCSVSRHQSNSMNEAVGCTRKRRRKGNAIDVVDQGNQKSQAMQAQASGPTREEL